MRKETFAFDPLTAMLHIKYGGWVKAGFFKMERKMFMVQPLPVWFAKH